MVRFVVDADGRLLPDVLARAPGRGFWIGAERAKLELARTRSLFAKQARRRVEVSADIADQVERLIAGRCLDLMGLARRAGYVVVGFDKVAAALRESGDGLLVTASDAAADGRGKLFGLARERSRLSAFTRIELGACLGRPEVVHMFVRAGDLADQLIVEAKRLSGFRQIELATGALGALDREGMSQQK
jgi:predicted RNA-binding protein YlxR (DUF448 family)